MTTTMRDHGRVTTLSSAWAQAAAGDGAVFTMFYERHGDRVFAHCFTRTGSRASAEDLTAQVFEIAWRRRAAVRVDEEADILPWLLATANNLLAAHHRSGVRARRLLTQLPQPEHEPDHAATLAEREQLDIDLERAMTVLQALRPADREVIELCVLHGLKPSAAAAVTGISPSTVRTRLARALARARARYSVVAAQADGTLAAEVTE